MDKEIILEEVRRTAQANGGKPLGRARFSRQTGLKDSDWGRYWARWSDVVKAAGLKPNTLNQPIPLEDLLRRVVLFTRELGHLPTSSELRLRARQDPTFPSHNTFTSRLGLRADLVESIRSFCLSNEDFRDMLAVLPQRVSPPRGIRNAQAGTQGAVYLIKSGRYYKVGHSNSVGRRAYEIQLQLPEPIKVVHEIKTDDPQGIEEYWHKRFSSKRKGGEWFALGPEDLRAFKSRRSM
jgi:hypothetical protein